MKTGKYRIVQIFAAFFLLPLLLLSSAGLQLQASAHTVHPDMTFSDKTDCLSLCSNRLNLSEVSLNNREEDEDRELEPRSSKQYYLQFAALANVAELADNDELLRHLRWRPPDLFKLYENYRI